MFVPTVSMKKKCKEYFPTVEADEFRTRLAGYIFL